MAKSFISFLVGTAIDEGLINSVNDPMTKYIPELKERDMRFEKITIKNLLEMRSGLKYNTSYLFGTYIHAPWHDEAVGYYHNNVRKLLLKDVEIASKPGQQFQYLMRFHSAVNGPKSAPLSLKWPGRHLS